ncbi:MAG: flagellar assembly protein FliW [Candidatus Hydrogenedentes bacterium]|nr:flagellar assembly protein FliW [Candidatus Hydrogenedentota bacterium]
MQLKTSRFGTIEIEPSAILTFTQPIIGFQEYRRFILLPGPADSSVHWLQSTDSGDLAFLIMDPRQVMPDYKAPLPAQELAELAVSSVDELDVYTLLVVPDDHAKVRTNLRAPVLINLKQRLGKQTVLDRTDYPIQYFLAQGRQKSPATQEAGHAGADA